MNSIVNPIVEKIQNQLSVNVSMVCWFLEKPYVFKLDEPELLGSLWIEVDNNDLQVESFVLDLSDTEISNSMLKFTEYTPFTPSTPRSGVIVNSLKGIVDTTSPAELRNSFFKVSKRYYVAQIQTRSPHLVDYFDKHLVEFLVTEKSSRVFKLKIRSPQPVYMLFDMFNQSHEKIDAL